MFDFDFSELVIVSVCKMQKFLTIFSFLTIEFFTTKSAFLVIQTFQKYMEKLHSREKLKKSQEIVTLLTIADKDLEQINVERAIPDPKPICANRLAKIDTVIPKKTKY